MRQFGMGIRLAFFGLVSLVTAPPAFGQVVVLHSFKDFAGGLNDGSEPYGNLTMSDSNLYGMTYYGGDAGFGSVFQMGTDGNGFSVQHSFAGGSDGRNPQGSLLQSGSTLYGMTQFGGNGPGAGGNGTLLRLGMDGNNYGVVRSFGVDPADGGHPTGNLIQVGSTVYGMTTDGGVGGGGIIFQTNADGTGYVVVHSFAGGASDGFKPYGSLIQSGSTLYGMTSQGGAADSGTIFKVGLDGSGFTVIHTFTDADGISPHGSLVLSGSTLYGMTSSGGAGTGGTIFKLGTDGAGFSVLHNFQPGPADGFRPFGSLTAVGSMLYGMTQFGGSQFGMESDGDADPGDGTIFRLSFDGSGYEVLYSFTDSPDGAIPFGDLIVSGWTLYGMTAAGGDFGYGTVFSFPASIPEPSSLALVAAASSAALLVRRIRGRRRRAHASAVAR